MAGMRLHGPGAALAIALLALIALAAHAERTGATDDETLLTLPLEELMAVRETPASRGIFRSGPAPANGFPIGVLVPLARFPEYSAQVIGVLELAARAINAAGGSAGRSVDLVFADDAADPEQAVLLAQRLVQEYHVEAILGPMNASRVLAVGSRVSVPAGVPLVAPTSSGEAIERLAATGPVWRLAARDRSQADAIDRFLADANERDIGLVYSRVPYGVDLRKRLLDALAARGVEAPPEIALSAQVDYAQHDLGDELAGRFARKPRTVVVLATSELAAPMLWQLAAYYGPARLRIVASDAVHEAPFLRHVEARLLGCTAFALPATSRRALSHIEDVMRQLGLDLDDASFEVAYAHDALYVLALAEVLRQRAQLPSLATALPRIATRRGPRLHASDYTASARKLGKARSYSFSGLTGAVRLGREPNPEYRLWKRVEGRLEPLDARGDWCP